MKREEHAACINEAWQRGVEAILETGRRINDARKGLEYGDFFLLVKNDLLVTRQTAYKLAAIASNKVLADVAHVRHLPPSWGTLSELAVIANKGVDLEAAIERGDIHPRLERKDVKALLPPPPQRFDDLEVSDDTVETDPLEESEDTVATTPLAAAWERASTAEQKSFLHSLGRKVLLEALEAVHLAADRAAEAAAEPKRRRPPIDATATDDLSDTLVARMWRGESFGAPEEPYETTALANGNGADRWSEK